MNRNFAVLTTLSLLVLTTSTGIVLSGCGYVVGSPYRSDIRTIHVPTFTNEAFRAKYTGDGYRLGIETQLTEAVQKQIQLRTPFKLVNDVNADTRLTGRLVDARKRVVNQNQYDDPRELELTLGVEILWEDRRTGEILAQKTVAVDPHMTQTLMNVSYAPETGQSLQTATQEAVTQMARRIVGMMELPW